MNPLSDELLYYYHNQLTIVMVLLWFIISYLGYSIKNNKLKIQISYTLILFSLLQEILDWLNRIYFDSEYTLSLRSDLPLQYCIFGFYFSIIGIYLATRKKKNNPKVEQFIFDCAYVLGFSGGLQALFTVDLTGINNMIGVFSLNWAHSLIILNVLWLIFAYNKKFEFFSIFRAYAFIVLIILPVGLINYLLIKNGINANYMFICSPPNVNSVFFIGEWPIYIYWLAGFYFVYVFILYLPFKIVHYFKK